MKAVFLDYSTMGPGLTTDRLCNVLPEIQFRDATGAGEVAAHIDGVEFVLCNKVRLTGELIRNNPSLKFIGLTATGTDNVDLEAARSRNIAVCNIRAYCTASIAEHVFTNILFLTRQLGEFQAAVRRGDWQKSTNFCLHNFSIRELSAMTLGIVGYGELGKGVARVADAFGMNVIVSARPGSVDIPDDRVSFDTMLDQADIISLHCPLNDETFKLFAADEFRRMKSDAILVNTARGGLVDSQALAAALLRGDIGAAAIDVLPEEPPINGDPLLDYVGPNLLVTPHIAWASNEARQAAIDQLTDCVSAFLAGDKLNRVD